MIRQALMIKQALWIGTIALILNSTYAHAQVEGCGFTPSVGPSVHVPIGTFVTLHTTASAGLQPRGTVSQAHFSLSVPFWADVEPSSFWATWGMTSTDVRVDIESDTPTCIASGPWLFMGQDSNSSIGAVYGFGPVVFYDPHVIGHANRGHETMNFGAVKLNDSGSLRTFISFDSLAVYRNFAPKNVHPPFYITDTVPMHYPCDVANAGLYTSAWFRPINEGHYIDTAYLLDPLTNDSLPLILIGDCVTADASTSAFVKLPLQVYPTPCNQVANIALDGEALDELDIRNSLGITVRSYRNVNSDITVDAESLPDGIYFLHACSNRGMLVGRLVVVH